MKMMGRWVGLSLVLLFVGTGSLLEVQGNANDAFSERRQFGGVTAARNFDEKRWEFPLVASLSPDYTKKYVRADRSAQALDEYVGRFRFPHGTSFPEVAITIEQGVLTANTSAGSTALKWVQRDVFNIEAYGGTLTYLRNEANEITKIRVVTDDLDVEGDKVE